MKNGILKGLRVLEGSAFVAAPLGGMTSAVIVVSVDSSDFWRLDFKFLIR